MARPRKARQAEPLPLLALIEAQGRCREAQRAFRRGLAADLGALPVAREVVAAEMSRLLGLEVNKSRLDCWTSPEKPHRMPAEHLPAFVQATGQYGALRALVEACGCVLVVPDQVRAALARVEGERRRLEERERALRALSEAVETGVLG